MPCQRDMSFQQRSGDRSQVAAGRETEGPFLQGWISSKYYSMELCDEVSVVNLHWFYLDQVLLQISILHQLHYNHHL